MPKRIPVSAARKFAEETGCTQVIVMAWDGQRSHVVTFGKTAIDCDQAAQGGDLMKATMGWPYDPTCVPSRVKKLQAELAAARRTIDDLKADLAAADFRSNELDVRDRSQIDPFCGNW